MNNEKTTKITLSNDFHDTEINVRVRFDGFVATLSRSQTARVRRELCGRSECCCGAVRGSQGDYDVQEVLADPRKSAVTVYIVVDMRE